MVPARTNSLPSRTTILNPASASVELNACSSSGGKVADETLTMAPRVIAPPPPPPLPSPLPLLELPPLPTSCGDTEELVAARGDETVGAFGMMIGVDGAGELGAGYSCWCC
jgi:hypothetical protein